jgi:hypothetical protein
MDNAVIAVETLEELTYKQSCSFGGFIDRNKINRHL